MELIHLFKLVSDQIVLQENELILLKTNICNLDYSHFLTYHNKDCKRFHGHGSYNISIVVVGSKLGDMVIDYGTIKEIVRETIVKELDHKLIVCSKYVKGLDSSNSLIIEYNTVLGSHKLILPKTEVFIFDREPTNENLVEFFTERILLQMPYNISGLGLFMSEGNNNGCYCFKKKKEKPSVEELGNS